METIKSTQATTDRPRSLPRVSKDSSVSAILDLTEAFRLLGPTLHRLREEHKGQTILPNALNPIAPGMAWGYDVKKCLQIRTEMESHPAWRELSPLIKRSYDQFCKLSCNELIWAGWNYWDLTKPSGEQRQIQVVVSSSPQLAKTTGTVTPLINSLPELSRASLTEIGAVKRKQKGLDENVCGPVGNSTTNNRDFAEGVWTLFTRGVERFRSADLLTIADLLHRNLSSAEPVTDVAPVVFNIGPRNDEGINSDFPRVTAFSFEEGQVRGWWQWVEQMCEGQIASNQERSFGPAEQGMKACSDWVRLLETCLDAFKTNREGVPQSLRDVVYRARQVLRCANDSEALYLIINVLLFHLSFETPQFCVLPVVSGSHCSVMILGMKKLLAPNEIRAWHELAIELFGSLIVSHLAEIELAFRLRRKADEQREMLSHSLPKVVFKPLEFFTLKAQRMARLSESIDENPAGYGWQQAALEDDIRNNLRILHLLTKRGQQVLADYASANGTSIMNGHNGIADQTTNLYDLCCDFKDLFSELKVFFVAGLVDRVLKRAVSPRPFREELLSSPRAFICEVYGDKRSAEIRANSAIFTMHLWNLVDNAFRYIDYSKIFRQGGEIDSALLLAFRIKLENPAVVWEINSTGVPILPERVPVLNDLFSLDSHLASCAAEKVRSWKDTLDRPGLEGENQKQGLARFGEYLRQLWAGLPSCPNTLGTVVSEGNLTNFRFAIPAVR